MKFALTAKFCACTVAALLVSHLSGCGTPPIAAMNECKGYRGYVEEPWMLSPIQGMFDSSNVIDTTSDSSRRSDAAPVKVAVRNVEIQADAARKFTKYEVSQPQDDLKRAVESASVRFDRFIGVSQAEASMLFDARLDSFEIAGDALKSQSDIASKYKGPFWQTLDYKEAVDKSRDLLRVQLTITFIDKASGNSLYSSVVTAFYARGHGQLWSSVNIDQANRNGHDEFNGGKLDPANLAAVFGKASEAALVDAINLKDRVWWAEKPDPTGRRPALVGK